MRGTLFLVVVSLAACGSSSASGPCDPGARECRDGDGLACRADGAPDVAPDVAPDAPPDFAETEPDPTPEAVDEPVEPGCGDGAVQAPEACEPGQPLGKTCGQLGYVSGALACHADCTFDTSGCDAFVDVAYVKTVEGVNGTGSHDWLVSTDVLLDTSPAGFGNFGRGAWRPGGDCAVFGAWSTQNKVYAFAAGEWSYRSFSAPYFSAMSAAWNAAGTRLLAVGDAGGGADLVGSVHEFRPAGADCTTGTWVNQTIPDFGDAPWLGKGDTAFHHAAFRPHSDCTEGLIAAADNGLSYNPTFGLAIRFHDTANPACE